ncbi:MAG: hypothetical protein LUD52_03730 [Opitutae bacterium]|nr:hypothetical protein [Opitutae bacterium]
MKNLILIFEVALLWGVASVCVLGENVKVVSVDFWSYPVLEVGDKTISGPDADLYLWKYNRDNANLAEELAARVENSNDTDAAILLCALSDRIFNPEKSVFYKTFIEEKYLTPTVYSGVSEAEKEQLISLPPVLRFYLFCSIHEHTVEKKYGFLIDNRIPGAASELISSGYFDEFSKCLEEIRKTDSIEENLGIDFLALSLNRGKDPQLNKINYMYDEARHKDMLLRAPANSLSAKLFRDIEIFSTGTLSLREKMVPLEVAVDTNFLIESCTFATAYFEMLINGKTLSDEDIEKTLYASYLALRNKSQLGERHLTFTACTAGVFAKQKNYEKLATIISYINNTTILNQSRYSSHPELLKKSVEWFRYAAYIFNREFGEPVSKVYPREYARGFEMAGYGFYEDPELEKRFNEIFERRLAEKERTENTESPEANK